MINQTTLIVFIAVITFFFILLDTYFLVKWNNLVKKRNWKKVYFQIPLAIAIIMLLLSLYISYERFFTGEKNITANVLYIVTSFWYLPKILIVPVMLIFDSLKLLINFIKYIFKSNKAVKIQPIPIQGRRKFIQNVTWSFAGLPFLAAYKGLVHSVYDIKVTRINIPLMKLHVEHEGLRIVQISDIHFGSFYSRKPLMEALFTTNNLQPDLIFITGDFVNFNPIEMDFGFDIINSLKARYGIFACLGNHDHYMTDEEHVKLLTYFDGSNIKLLNNDNEVLNIKGKPINIVGVDNYGSRQTFGDFDKALDGLSSINTTLLLCHDPANWDRFIKGKKDVDIMFAGHTHGGQVAFDIYGKYVSPVALAYEQFAGLYHKSGQYLYVNRGLGTSGPPIRLGVNPEITIFTLKSPEDYA